MECALGCFTTRLWSPSFQLWAHHLTGSPSPLRHHGTIHGGNLPTIRAPLERKPILLSYALVASLPSVRAINDAKLQEHDA